MWTVRRALNNNVVLVRDEFGTEKILVGNGVGFNAKTGFPFTMERQVKKVFELSDQMAAKKFKEVVNTVDPKLVAIIEEQIFRIQRELDVELNENIHSTLIDHIAFAIDRKKKGLEFSNPLQANVRYFYEEEYNLAQELIYSIKVNYGVELIEDEIAFVAIHIHAARSNKTVEKTKKIAELVQETLDLLQEITGLTFHEDKYSYQRFLMHMQFAFERILSGDTIINDLSEEIKVKYPGEYQVVKNVLKKVSEKNQLQIPDSEVCYLTLHLCRLESEN